MLFFLLSLAGLFLIAAACFPVRPAKSLDRGRRTGRSTPTVTSRRLLENTGYRVRPLQFWYGIQNSLKELSSRTPSGSESPAIRPENPDQARSDAFTDMGDPARRRMMRPGGVDLARALREDGAATLEGVQFEA
ncbi:MAG: hypothetical protein KDK27_14000, partial [Leptospiraceae bacterium]|nr:hypothetical protein [Leptospiraceae bacterium]